MYQPSVDHNVCNSLKFINLDSRHHVCICVCVCLSIPKSHASGTSMMNVCLCECVYLVCSFNTVSALARSSAGCVTSSIAFTMLRHPRRVRKFWCKELVYTCPRCWNYQINEIHSTNKNALDRISTEPPVCDTFSIHQCGGIVDMVLHTFAIYRQDTPNRDLLAPGVINAQKLVPPLRI